MATPKTIQELNRELADKLAEEGRNNRSRRTPVSLSESRTGKWPWWPKISSRWSTGFAKWSPIQPRRSASKWGGTSMSLK